MQKTYYEVIHRALIEDRAMADRTTLSTVPAHRDGYGIIFARQIGVLAGLHIAAETFRLCDPQVSVEVLVEEGERVLFGQEVMRLSGPARSLLCAERVALNFLGRLSGIATLTARCMRELRETGAQVLPTCQATPGLRALEHEAVCLGGGQKHPFDLHGGVLITENHRKAVGGIRSAVNAARSLASHLLKIEVVCQTQDDVDEAVQAGVDMIQLDQMNLEIMRRAVTRIRQADSPMLIAASGFLVEPPRFTTARIPLDVARIVSVDPSKLAVVAAIGVDFISLGALTHSAPNFALSFTCA